MGCLKLTEEKKGKNDIMLENFFNKNKEKDVQFTDKVAEKVKEDVAEQVKNDLSKDMKESVVEQVKEEVLQQVKEEIVKEVSNQFKLKNLFKIENGADFITVAGAFITVGIFVASVYSLNTTVNALDEKVTKIDNEIHFNNGIIDDLEEIQKTLDIEDQQDAKILSADDEIQAILDNLSVESNDISYTTSSLSAEMLIGVDDTGKPVYAEELLGENVLLAYKEDEKDVFFIGQYNENYHWDGYCVINTYNSDGSLYGICESNFEDGKRLDYKTVLCVGENKWDYYSRKCNGESNAGVSIEYGFEYNRLKNFDSSNVKGTDILYADDFIANQDAVMFEYYYGNTSDEYYNDDTGKAYLITFHEDSTVKVLYVGKLVDGYPCDSTGKAWSIAYAESLEGYVHNTGRFSDGHAVNGSDEKISQDDIDNLIKNLDIKYELNWKYTE